MIMTINLQEKFEISVIQTVWIALENSVWTNNFLIFTVFKAVKEFAICGHFTTLKQNNGNNLRTILRDKLYNFGHR